MPLLRTKQNFLCGAYFTGKSFLIIEFDNTKNKKTIRTKGEMDVENLVDENFFAKDKFVFLEIIKKIRKNTKSKKIYINKNILNKDITHLREFFILAGFERIIFKNNEDILNRAFRKENILGANIICIIERDSYNFYLSTEDGVTKIKSFNSLKDIDFNDDEFRKKTDDFKDDFIDLYGLQDFNAFDLIEDIFFQNRFRLNLANVWQNSFSLNNHIPSISKEESSAFAIPVALALSGEKDGTSEKVHGGENSINKKSISETGLDKLSISTVSVSEYKEVQDFRGTKEPVILEEVNIKTNFDTKIDLPIFNNNDPKDGLSTYVPKIKENTPEIPAKSNKPEKDDVFESVNMEKHEDYVEHVDLKKDSPVKEKSFSFSSFFKKEEKITPVETSSKKKIQKTKNRKKTKKHKKKK